jgi:dTDP-4-dehydrorhamnose 3,5-epimerase
VRAFETTLPGVLRIESPVYHDTRGFFTEVFRETAFAQLGLATCFVQDNHSRSMRNTLRGVHYQLEAPQGKLVRPVTGVVFDVAIDLRRTSSHFGKWVGVTLTAGDGQQLWIPPGFAHAFLVLSEYADVSYKCTTAYHPASDRCIAWNDPSLAIEWPLHGVHPLLSAKDAVAPHLADATVFD